MGKIGDVERIAEQYSWKHLVFFVGFNVFAHVVFGWVLPEVPPLWVAVIFAALFAVFAIGAPLFLIRLRRRHPLNPDGTISS